MRSPAPSPRLVDQRIRNRLIEYLDTLAFFQTDHPPFDLNELLNQWEDWIPAPLNPEYFAAPTYTHDEAQALLVVGDAWNAFCDVTPQTITDEAAAVRLPEWGQLVLAARSALDVLNQRGKLNEEHAASS